MTKLELLNLLFIILDTYEKIKVLQGGRPITARQIFNLDESGFQFCASKGFVLASKGLRHIKSIASGGRDHVSSVGCVSASGRNLTPFFILKGKKSKPQGWSKTDGHEDMGVDGKLMGVPEGTVRLLFTAIL